MNDALAILLLPAVSVGTVTSQAFMKQGLQQMGGIAPSHLLHPLDLAWRALQTPALVIGGLISVVALVVWLTALSRFDLSRAGAVVGGSYYLILGVVSWYVLGEQLSLLRIAGLSVIGVGVLMVVMS